MTKYKFMVKTERCPDHWGILATGKAKCEQYFKLYKNIESTIAMRITKDGEVIQEWSEEDD